LKAVENGVEEELLIEAAKRDPSCFAQLYESNFDRVYAFVARRVAGRDQAEDLTAEVFHQALAGLAKFEWRGVPFVAWLLGIAARLVAHRWQNANHHEEAMLEEVADWEAGEEVERHATFASLVDGLPRDQREVIVARFLEQKSLREIAQQMGRTEGAIKQLQFRAVQTLRSRVRSRT